jgi:hypothetical protein
MLPLLYMSERVTGADCLDLLRAPVAGAGRSAFTSGGEGTRNGEDVVGLVRTSQAIGPGS